jgi:signal transduction histidine kinase
MFDETGAIQVCPCEEGSSESVHESLSLLETTLESMADGLLVVDGYGRIKKYNQQFQTLWRLPDDVLADCDDDKALAFAMTQLRDPRAFIASVRDLYGHRETEGHGLIEFRDGRIVEYDSKPHRMGDRIVGRVWNFRDVTVKHTAEQKQTALLQKVAAINEELTHFAYIVSHDLKAPLRGIKLVAEWLCADYGDKLGDEGKEQLNLLQSRVARMHNLIDGVLQYSRVGRIKEDMAPVDLNELIPSVVDGIAPPEHIRVIVQPDLPVIEGERTRITQVFQNLLGNAVKFIDKPVGEVKIGCVQDGDFWRFSVSDNGPGIDAKYFDRIFRLFQTLASRDEFESTGVGLAVVKKIVEMYGGRIWVESEVRRGSSFHFTFPNRRSSWQPSQDAHTA